MSFRPGPRLLTTRRRRAAALGAVTALAAGAAGFTTGASADSRRPTPLAPVGIVSASAHEQAAVLTEMKVTGHVEIAGYIYYLGTIGGVPVVDVASGEIDETAELATWILDETFHPRATVFSGTAGAQNAKINVGDVVVAGYVVDKSSIHYQLNGYQTPYSGVEIHSTGQSDIAGAIIDGYGDTYPTPSDASTYTSSTDKNWVYVSAFAATKALDATALKSSGALGTTTIADATGDSTATGTVTNKVVVGSIGQADVWTEPLSWVEAQNMLYQTDAEENEGSGFAFANAAAGVPWTLVRGISDTPWYPNAYDSKLASSRAASVTAYLVTHLPKTVSKTAVAMSDLSSVANAREAGYLVADQAYFTVSPVTKVTYTTTGGSTSVLTGSALAALESEYKYGAADLK